MFALELSMKKWIKKNWVAGFSVIPAIIAFGFSNWWDPRKRIENAFISHLTSPFVSVMYQLSSATSRFWQLSNFAQKLMICWTLVSKQRPLQNSAHSNIQSCKLLQVMMLIYANKEAVILIHLGIGIAMQAI